MMTFRSATPCHLAWRCCRLPPMYRYVAGSIIACVICLAHLLVNQAFLPAQTTDVVITQHPSTFDNAALNVMETSRRPVLLNDWVVGYDTGCDVIDRDDFVDANHVTHYRFNCSNIGHILLRHQIGHGVTKRVYLGSSVDDDGRRRQVAVKMVTRKSLAVTRCVQQMTLDADDTTDRQRCFVTANMKLLKEILLLNQLRHRGLLPLLGYCVRSDETESTSLHDHGVLAVYEYGTHFYATSMRDWPLDRRLDTAIQLVDLADYLHRSPLDSLRVSDFKETHFLLLDGDRRIVMTDLDDVTSAEPPCDSAERTDTDRQASQLHDMPTRCSYELQCLGGQCQGHNTLHNLDHLDRLFLRHLLHADDAKRWFNAQQTDCLQTIFSAVRDRLKEYTLTPRQLLCQLYAAQRCITLGH